MASRKTPPPVGVSELQQADHNAGPANQFLTGVSPTLRHSFVTNLLEDAYDSRMFQELLAHKHVKTTTPYAHVLNKGGHGARSPVDELCSGLYSLYKPAHSIWQRPVSVPRITFLTHDKKGSILSCTQGDSLSLSPCRACVIIPIRSKGTLRIQQP